VAVSAVDQGSTPVTNGTITVNGETYNITGESTVVPVSVDIVGANVTVNYMGDDTYNGSSAVVEIIPDKRDVSLDADLTNSIVGSATLFVEVSDSITGEANATGNIVVTIDDVEYNGTIENGIAIVDLSDLAVGSYSVDVAYVGDDYYNAKTVTTGIVIERRNTTTTVSIVNNTYGNVSVNVTVNAVDQGSTPVTNGTITVNGETYNVTGESTVVPVSVDIVGANVTVNYMGDDTYNGSSAVVEVIPDKRNVSLDSDLTNDVVGSATLFVEVSDSITGEFNATGNVIVTIEGAKYNGTIENGIAVIDLSDLAVGTYSPSVVYSGDDYYNDKAIIGLEIDIVLRNTTTTVTVMNNTYGNVSVSVAVKAVDQESTPVTNGTITVNGETYNITGETTTIALDLKVGEYEVTVDYAGSDEYAESNNTITINVVALGTTTVVDEVVAYSGDNVTLKATITDDLGNLVNSGKVAFKVNGKTIGTATVSKGVATLNTTALKSWVKDGVTVFAKYAGGSNYVTSNDTADVTVTLKTATVNIITTGVYQPGNNITLMAMVSTDSKVVNSGYVIFKLNGITLTDAQGNIIKANVTNGLAQASYTLSNSIAASNHTITAVFIEENYNRAEDNDTFSVAKAKVLLEINDISINEGQPAILTGKLVDKFGNLVTRSTKITVKINGVSFIAAQTVSNGIINFTLNQSTNGKTSIDKFKLNKIYDIVVYAGENNRNLGANATAILVKK
ncbi:MAG: Ig-like domain repeat protein, partial [Methanosphaera stadtmanae]|nr:Ig-like domain repeat protein [Methanosphaera stadtmanae]